MDFDEKLSALSKERLLLYKNHFKKHKEDNSNLFDSEFFDKEFKVLLQAQLKEISDIFIGEFRSFSGNPLINYDDIEFEIEDDDHILFEIVPDYEEEKSTIFVGIKSLFYIDLLTSVFQYRPYTKHKNIKKEKWRWPCALRFSNGLHLKPEIIQFLLDMLEEISISLHEFDTSNSVSSWAKKSGLSLFFLLSHEYSHYLCGHTGFYNYIEKLYGNDFEKHKKDLYLEYFWIAEFMADTYAIMRLMYSTVQKNKDNNTIAIKNEIEEISSIANFPRSILSVCFVPMILLQLSDLKSKHSSFIITPYPDSLARIFGIFASADFFMRPLYMSFGDLRDNPARDYLSKGRFNEDISLFGLFASYSDGINSYWMTISDLSLFELISPDGGWNVHRDSELFLKRMSCAREGLTNLILPSTDYSKDMIDAICLWSSCMRGLCTKYNGYYAPYIKKQILMKESSKETFKFHPEFIKENGSENLDQFLPFLYMPNQVIDPVYKILNDWMGNIQFYAEELSKDQIQEREKIVEFKAMLAYRNYIT